MFLEEYLKQYEKDGYNRGFVRGMEQGLEQGYSEIFTLLKIMKENGEEHLISRLSEDTNFLKSHYLIGIFPSIAKTTAITTMRIYLVPCHNILHFSCATSVV